MNVWSIYDKDCFDLYEQMLDRRHGLLINIQLSDTHGAHLITTSLKH